MDGRQPSGLELGLLTVTLGRTQEEEEDGSNDSNEMSKGQRKKKKRFRGATGVV